MVVWQDGVFASYHNPQHLLHPRRFHHRSQRHTYEADFWLATKIRHCTALWQVGFCASHQSPQQLVHL